MNLLLTDGQQRKTLAACRSLGKGGHRVLVADDTRFSTSRFSRYCFKGLLSPSPAQTEQYWQWLLAAIRHHAIDLFLPMDDQTTELAVERQEQLPCRTLLPTPAQFHACRDKASTAELAKLSGVRTPRTLQASTEEEALAGADSLGWPVVLKARCSSGGRGMHFVSSPEQLRAVWRSGRPEWGGFLVQERIPTGRKYDVCLLYDDAGRLSASFVQEELRWFPLEYGTSTLQESVDRSDLVALAERLLGPIGWRGPVEVEFMEDPAGEPVLMEVNPRFWASLALAIRCGVDFPGMIAELVQGAHSGGATDYPVGLRARWLLPGELLHFIASPDRFRRLPGLVARNDENTRDDIIDRHDMGPVLGFGLGVVRYMWDPRMWRLLLRW